MKKVILFLLNRECTYLPPFLTLLDSLCEEYSLKVISCEIKGGIERLKHLYEGKDVEFLSQIETDTDLSIFSRVKRRLQKYLSIQTRWHKEAVDLIRDTPCDLLWVGHEITAVEFKKVLEYRRFVLNIFELSDILPCFLKQLKPIAQKACRVIVPEYNRACMLKFWLQLKEIPIVIPNKPFSHPRKRNIKNDYTSVLVGKKVLLYQGFLNSNRNIDTICKAMEEMPEWVVVLMGRGEMEYVKHLKEDYPNIVHIEFVQPPHHLDITSWARIGIVKYDWYDLNHAYCAPNKTWEYAGFGIPMIGNELPGLRYSIGEYKAGVLTDLDNIDEIKAAIREIDNNYDEYSRNALTFYNSIDIEQTIKCVVDKIIQNEDVLGNKAKH